MKNFDFPKITLGCQKAVRKECVLFLVFSAKFVFSLFWERLKLPEAKAVWEFGSISINTISNETMPNGRKRGRQVEEREKQKEKEFH